MVILDSIEYSSDVLARAAWVADIDTSVNILTGATASASTSYSGTYSPAKAIDGSDGTRWATIDGGIPGWWKADLGAGVLLEPAAIGFKLNSSERTNAFTIQLSTDDINWTTVYTGNAVNNTDLQIFTLTTIVSCRYIKININSIYSGTVCSLTEVVAYLTEVNIAVSSESSIVHVGAYSMKIVDAQTTSLNKTLTKTLSPAFNLSGQKEIKFPVRASRTGSNFKLGFHNSDGTTTEVTPNITVADTWQIITLDMSAVADAYKDEIDSIILTVLNADTENTIYLDKIYALSDGEGSGGSAGDVVYEAETGRPFMFLNTKMITSLDGNHED